jgi:hypothetical protein
MRVLPRSLHSCAEWGHGLLEHLPKAKEYIQATGRDVEHYAEGIDYFEQAWMKYMAVRKDH